MTRVASSPMPGEFAAHSDQPAIPSQSPLSAPTSQRPVSREKSLPSGSKIGMTPTGASKQNSGASNTRPCIKSPPCRIQYSACSTPLPTMKATTAGGLCTARATRP
ncbi:Uncharacterised protein [Mycobacterium tuberculosis]|nr:Uncharacterised protein [Mycobacterium tuberculosis]